jgi:pimeloyl-ACP methyl ester carboxylesterase
MKSLQIEEAIIRGLSIGGYAAIDLARKYPQQVKFLVLAAPGLSGYDFNDKYMAKMDSQLYGALQQEDMKLFMEYFQQVWTDEPHCIQAEVDSSVREKVHQMAYETVTNWNQASNETSLDPPATGRLAEIRVPTLAVGGDLDMPVILRIVDLVEAQIPGAKKVAIPGVAHMLNMEKPQEFNKVVLEFLANLSTRK